MTNERAGAAAMRPPQQVPRPQMLQCTPDPVLGALVRRAKAEYEEMPGLCLTREQARRLWGLDSDSCDRVLALLVASGYLKVSNRRYARA